MFHPGDGSNVAEHVKSPVLGHALGDGRVTFGRIGYVDDPGVHRSACRGGVGDLCCYFVETLGVDVHAENGCTLGGESQCDASAHAARNSGHGCDSATVSMGNAAMICRRGL